jgi:thiamine phosphate synthase YjbQ (UPF0047 family)
VARSGISDGLVAVYARGAIAAILIQVNRDDSVRTDIITFLSGIIPGGVWRHDARDGNQEPGGEWSRLPPV